MANEILYSGLGDLNVAAQLGAFYTLLLADRDASALSHPALIDAGVGMPGSLVMQIPQVGLLGYDLMSAGSEGSDPGNTALTDGSDQITLALYDKIYEHGDLARMTDAFGILDPEMMAADCAITTALTLLDLLAALATGFSTNVVGSSGVDLVVQDLIDAQTKLRVANVQSTLCQILHPTQIGDINTDLASIGGAFQHRPDLQGFTRWTGGSYMGQLFGVDTFSSSYCDASDAGANVNGMVFGRGALLHGRGAFRAESDPNIIPIAVPDAPVQARLERIRSGRTGLTAWAMRAVMGVIEGQDAAGCRVRSDA